MKRTLLSLVLSACAISACAQTFVNPIRIPTPVTPQIVLAADLNGDGLPDLLYDDSSSGSAVTLHTLLNQGGASFLPGPVLTLPANTYASCVLADLNGDKMVDLACSEASTFSASVVFFAGKGDGSFAAPVMIPLPTSNQNYFDLYLTLAGDLNNDGVADLVAIDALNQRAFAVLSNARGGFTVGPNVPYLLGRSTVYLDVNEDGKLDAVNPGPSVALGNGDGTFGDAKNYGNTFTTGCAYADVDGDGRPDAICSIPGGTGDIDGLYNLSVLHGNPDGSFVSTPEYTATFGDGSNGYSGSGSLGVIIGTADLNHDGLPDILASSPDGTTIFFGQPGPSFAYPVHYATGNFGSGGYFPPQSQSVLDLNADGIPDVVCPGYNGLYITLGQSSGKLHAPPAFEVTGVISYAVTHDFNGDGIPDIISNGDNFLALSLGNGDGTFKPYTKINAANLYFQGYQRLDNPFIAGDFNGDGKQDLLVIASTDPSSINEATYYLQGNGDGTFKPPVEVGDGQVLFGMYDHFRVIDVNGDGKQDYLLNNGVGAVNNGTTGSIIVNLSNGDGTFKAISSPVPIETYENNTFVWPEPVPALADFDGDGKLDAVTGAQANLYVVFGNGDGSFRSPATALPIPQLSVTQGVTRSVATGDFDGDGKQDIAVLFGNNDPGGSPQYELLTQTVVYYGKGDGTFSAPVIAEMGENGFACIDAADLNEDGRSEIVLHAAGSLNGGNAVAVLHGLANRTWLPEDDYVAGNGLASLDIIDINQDGYPDLIFSNGDFNGAANTVTVLLNNGPQQLVTGTLTATPEPSNAGASFTLTASLTPPDQSQLSGTVSFVIDGNSAGSASLSANQAKLPVSAPLSVGTHSLSAVWSGSSTFPAVTLTGSHTVIGLPTTLSLTSAPNPSTVGQTVIFSWMLAGPTGGTTPATGTISFTDNGTPLVQESLNGSVLPASSQYATAALTAGTHTIVAMWSGDSDYASSTASLTQIVNALPVTMTLTPAPSSALVGQSVTLTAAVSTPSSCSACAFTVPVQFLDGSSSLGSAEVVNGVASIPVTFTSAGTHLLTANFPGDSFHSSASATATEIVNAVDTDMLLSTSLNPAAAGAPVTFTARTLNAANSAPVTTGSIIFADGGVALATVPLSATGSASLSSSTLSVGIHSISARLAPSTAFNSSSAALQQTIVPAATTLLLSATPNPVYQSQPLALTAKLSSVTGIASTGSIQFLDGTTPLPPQPLASDTAVLTTSSLTVGPHTITATWAGDANTVPAQSVPLTITVLASDFSLATNPPTITVKTAHHLNFQLNIQSTGAFADRLDLSTASLPEYMTVRMAQDSTAVAQGGTSDQSVYLDTDGVLGYAQLDTPVRGHGTTLIRWACAPAALLLIALTRKRRHLGLLMLLLALAALPLTACSSLYPPSTPPGTYVIDIHAVGEATRVAHTLKLQVVVTE